MNNKDKIEWKCEERIWNNEFVDLCEGCTDDACNIRKSKKDEDICEGCNYMNWNGHFADPCSICKITKKIKKEAAE